jgi:hypothetical protein
LLITVHDKNNSNIPGYKKVETIFEEINNEGKKFMIGVNNEFYKMLTKIKDECNKRNGPKLKEYVN